MTKSAQEILAEWADPETGGTMPKEVREAALSVLRLVAEWNQPTPESEWQKMCNRAEKAEAERDAAWKVREAAWEQTEDALARMRAAEARVKALEAKVERLQGFLRQFDSYFGNGGLFSPEAMEHNKVRDLLLDMRAALGKP